MAMESNTKETKIVRATPKKTEGQQEEQPRVTVKAAVKPQVRNQQKQVRPQQQPQEKAIKRPPMGKPVANKELEGRDQDADRQACSTQGSSRKRQHSKRACKG